MKATKQEIMTYIQETINYLLANQHLLDNERFYTCLALFDGFPYNLSYLKFASFYSNLRPDLFKEGGVSLKNKDSNSRVELLTALNNSLEQFEKLLSDEHELIRPLDKELYYMVRRYENENN